MSGNIGWLIPKMNIITLGCVRRILGSSLGQGWAGLSWVRKKEKAVSKGGDALWKIQDLGVRFMLEVGWGVEGKQINCKASNWSCSICAPLQRTTNINSDLKIIRRYAGCTRSLKVCSSEGQNEVLWKRILLFRFLYLWGLNQKYNCPISWGCRIHRPLLCRGVRPPSNECPGYDTKQSDGEVPAMLELWGMRSTSSLPSLPGPLWPGVVAPDRALSMG